MGILASIGASILGFVLKRSTTDFLGKIVARLAGTEDGRFKLEELRATTSVALKKEETAQLAITASEGTARQQTKMNNAVFWWMIAIMFGPTALMLWSVGLYNIFWWRNGIWPQAWSIAEFPPSVKPWIDAGIKWLYDPFGPPLGVGTALVAGALTGKRSK